MLNRSTNVELASNSLIAETLYRIATQNRTINKINKYKTKKMNDTLQQVILELKRQKKAESFPDHICAQANRVMCSASSISENAHLIKYEKDGIENLPYLKDSLISTIACCLRMLEEIEK